MSDMLDAIVDRELTERIGSPSRMMAYMEHQIDLTGSVLLDIVGIVRTLAPNQFTEEIETKLNLLSMVLQNASINFSDLGSPFESYKIPQATKLKGIIRDVQNEFLDAKLREQGIIP